MKREEDFHRKKESVYNNDECNSNSDRREREKKTLSRYCKEEKESTHVSLGLEQQTRRWEKIHF